LSKSDSTVGGGGGRGKGETKVVAEHKGGAGGVTSGSAPNLEFKVAGVVGR
jgi:hypothetical protein